MKTFVELHSELERELLNRQEEKGRRGFFERVVVDGGNHVFAGRLHCRRFCPFFLGRALQKRALQKRALQKYGRLARMRDRLNDVVACASRPA